MIIYRSLQFIEVVSKLYSLDPLLAPGLPRLVVETVSPSAATGTGLAVGPENGAP